MISVKKQVGVVGCLGSILVSGFILSGCSSSDTPEEKCRAAFTHHIELMKTDPEFLKRDESYQKKQIDSASGDIERLTSNCAEHYEEAKPIVEKMLAAKDFRQSLDALWTKAPTAQKK